MVSESEPKRITGGEGDSLPPEGTPFLNIGLSAIYVEIANNERTWRYNTSNVCGSYLPVGARWDEIEREGWQHPIVHFVFQDEALAERAHLAFGFTNTSAPFAVTQERIGAEYQVKFQYIGGPVYQPNQQLVIYYNGAPAGWLWILPYLVAGQIGWYNNTSQTRWQIQNPLAEALTENGSIPGLPIDTQDNQSPAALRVTIEETYAEWSQELGMQLDFRCVDRNGEYATKSFGYDDLDEIEQGAFELIIHISNDWNYWFTEWGIAQVTGLTATIDNIIWDNNQIQMSFDVGD